MKIKIPTSGSDITIGQYNSYLNSLKESDSDNDKIKKLISAFCRLTMEQVEQLEMSEYDKIAELMMPLAEITPRHVKTIEYDGTLLGFIPNFDNCTFGEIIAIDEQIRDVNDWPSCMSVLYRPVIAKYGDTYKIEPYDKRKIRPLEDFPYDVCLGVQSFFLNLRADLLDCTRSYIEAELQRKKTKNLQSDGDGLSRFTNFLQEISETEMQSWMKTFTMPCYGQLLKRTLTD